jgi:hypothetical protein
MNMNRKDDALVELTRVASIAEANAIRHDLERAGIAATVFESDGGGWAPHFSIAEGHRVMIHAGNMNRAQELVSHIGGQLEIDHSSPSSVIRKHRRPHGPTT